MSQIELSCGTMDYTDTGGAGAVLVFLHGPVAAGVGVVDGPVRQLDLGHARRPARTDAESAAAAGSSAP